MAPVSFDELARMLDLSSLLELHWFDPCALLAADTRSELRPEHRRMQKGGGWERRD